jgi:hypothetical protein
LTVFEVVLFFSFFKKKKTTNMYIDVGVVIMDRRDPTGIIITSQITIGGGGIITDYQSH